MKLRYPVLLVVFILSNIYAFSQKVSFEGLKDINGTQLYFKVIGEGEPLLIVHGGPGRRRNS